MNQSFSMIVGDGERNGAQAFSEFSKTYYAYDKRLSP